MNHQALRVGLPDHKVQGSLPVGPLGCIPLAMLIILSGCATQQTAVPVRVMVATPCLSADQLPVKPQISADADLLKLSDGDLILTIAGERIALKSYAGEMDALIQACLKP